MIIAYTLGATKSYNEALKSNPEVKKIGRTQDYDGGWIWKTKEGALEFLNSNYFLEIDWGDGKPREPNNFSVYGLIIDNWGQDTYLSEKDNQYHLTRDAQLFIV